MKVLDGFRGKGAIYFLRHGMTDGHAPGLMKGRGEQPLSVNGRDQARAAGGWLADKGLTLILSSPLTRARQTAAIVAGCGAAAETMATPLLTELDTGLFTGLTPEDAARTHPAAYAEFQKQGWDAVPGAEDSASLCGRASALWRELGNHTRQGHRTILCVVHKGVFQWIMRAPFGCGNWMPLFELDFCGLYRLSFDRENERTYFIWDIMNLVP